MPHRLFGRKPPANGSNGSDTDDGTDTVGGDQNRRPSRDADVTYATQSRPQAAAPAAAPRAYAQNPFPPQPGSVTALPPGNGFRPDLPRRVYEVAVPTYRRPAGGNGQTTVHGPATEPRKLIVGRDISLTGEISACDMLIVEGMVEATLRDGRLIEIAETGFFKGSVEIDEADLGGRFEGTIVVRGRMRVRSTGRVHGVIRYGELEVEAGGQIVGDVQVASPGCHAVVDRKPVLADSGVSTMVAPVSSIAE